MEQPSFRPQGRPRGSREGYRGARGGAADEINVPMKDVYIDTENAVLLLKHCDHVLKP